MSETAAVAGSIGDVVNAQDPGPQDTASLLRAAYDRAKTESAELDLVIPGYGEPASELHVTFHTLPDYKQLRSMVTNVGKRKELKTVAQRELALGLETLALAAESSYALINGQRVDIGLPLGLRLYNYLFADAGTQVQPQNDAQAITLIFHSHLTRLMTIATVVDQWIQTGKNPLADPGEEPEGDEAFEQVLGESQAG